jgi:hypothetical protein
MVRDALPILQATHVGASKRGAAGRPGGLMAMVVADPQTIQLLGGQAVVVASRTWVLRGLGDLAHEAARRLHGEEQAKALTLALAQLRLPPVAGHLRTALIGPRTVRVVDMPLSPGAVPT